MKTLIYILVLLSPLSSFAGACTWYDQLIEYNASLGRLEPQFTTVRQGDRVCVRLRAQGGGFNVMIQNFPVWLKANQSRGEETSFIAHKAGTFPVTCTGCGVKANLVILPKDQYDQKTKELYEKESILNRRYNYR